MELANIRTDGGTQPRARLYEETAQEYTEALKDGAEFPPVVVFYDGSDHWLADGFHRFHAYQLLGRDDIPATIHQGTRREAILYSVGSNSAHGLRRTNEDKRRAVETLLRDDEWSRWSDREIARQCGVGNQMVSHLRASLCESHSQPAERTYTTRHGTEAVMNTSNIGQRGEGPPEDAPPLEQPPDESHFRARGTGDNEWYTPPQYIERARELMGGIDLDPASSESAQQVVQAGAFYTPEDDGLAQPWHGRVWLNPPYSQPLIMHFIERLVRAVEQAEIEQAVLLTHNYTDTAWFHLAESAAASICFTRGRIGFVSSSGETAQPTQGQAFFYFGPDANKTPFALHFGDVGFIR